ncbi:hypothetical protein N3K66_007458 [Trichothecium roseum]|uniref:Uncharacterized protein n=1 Tax=Trichothecium roseum TaxID=47278 RepID=A0ACC0UWK8_9HYPO|nr:hypothetical protein N3K66_007458 [Trichothecium roseum]
MSEKYKNLMKNGWHPEKAGTTLRGQVSGLVHRNKGGSSSSSNNNHVAQPISSLKDPASFAPPPRRSNTGGAPPPPPPPSSSSPRKVIASPSHWQDPRGPPVAPPEKISHTQEQLDYAAQQGWNRQQEEMEAEEEQKPKGPYRVNTTGLDVSNLPLPPGRRDGANKRLQSAAESPPPPPPSYESAVHARGPPPSLPPRLPPRTNAGSASPSAPASNNSSSTNLLNQGAVSRLGAAGISVPGLGIGKPSSPAGNHSPSPPPPPRRANGGSTPPQPANELQNRFSKIGTSTPTTEGGGTTWAQKQAAIRTASNFQKDPSSVSLSDAKSAAGVANNFRQRHGEQVASGVSTANSLNQRYGVANKLGVGGPTAQQQDEQQSSPASAMSVVAGLAGKKKPPPPPPKKKPNLGGGPVTAAASTDDAPPPIPMSTRPTF